MEGWEDMINITKGAWALRKEMGLLSPETFTFYDEFNILFNFRFKMQELTLDMLLSNRMEKKIFD